MHIQKMIILFSQNISYNHDNQKEYTPTVKSLKEFFKATEDLDYKKELSDRLAKKYL